MHAVKKNQIVVVLLVVVDTRLLSSQLTATLKTQLLSYV